MNQTSVWCWGVNGGILGDGEREDSNQPVQVLPKVMADDSTPEPSSESYSGYWIIIPSAFSILGLISLVYLYNTLRKD